MVELLTTGDVARFLKISRRQVQILRREGRLCQPLRIGSRSVRWRQEDVSAFLASEVERQNAAGGGP